MKRRTFLTGVGASLLLPRMESLGQVSEADSPRRLLTITENGYGKRTELEAYPVQNRGGLGVITIKTTDRNGPVASCRLVAEDDQLIIITNGGQLIRIRVDGVSVLGRNTQGVRLINASPVWCVPHAWVACVGKS